MVRRFIKIPISKEIRKRKEAIHHVWLEADKITKVTFENDEHGHPRVKVFYLTPSGKETWYRPCEGVISTEEIIAKIMGPEISAEDREMIDSELALTLMQTQCLLQETWSENQKLKEEVANLESKKASLLREMDGLWENNNELKAKISRLKPKPKPKPKVRVASIPTTEVDGWSDAEAFRWFLVIVPAGFILLIALICGLGPG